MWDTCRGPRGTPGDGLDGFSSPKNPHFDPSHPSVAPTSQKLHSDNTGAKRVKRANGGYAGTDSRRLQNEKFLF